MSLSMDWKAFTAGISERGQWHRPMCKLWVARYLHLYAAACNVIIGDLRVLLYDLSCRHFLVVPISDAGG
jgi:hypothetical protein